MADSEITEYLNVFGAAVTADIKNELQAKDISATGSMQRSVNYTVQDGVIEIKSNDYFYFVEHGRKPGKMPPKEKIKEWAGSKQSFKQRTGWDRLKEREKNSLVFLIQRKIANEGTNAYKNGGNDILLNAVQENIGALKSSLALTFKQQTAIMIKSAIINI